MSAKKRKKIVLSKKTYPDFEEEVYTCAKLNTKNKKFNRCKIDNKYCNGNQFGWTCYERKENM